MSWTCVSSHFWLGYMMCIHGWTNSMWNCIEAKCVCAYRASSSSSSSSLNVSACLPKFHSPYLPIQFQKSIVKYWMGQTLFEFKSDFTASILHRCALARFVWWLLFSSSALSLSVSFLFWYKIFATKSVADLYELIHPFISYRRNVETHSFHERAIALLQTCSTCVLVCRPSFCYYLISKIHIYGTKVNEIHSSLCREQ